MTEKGKIVYRPETPHACNPGCRLEEWGSDGNHPLSDAPPRATHYVVLPREFEYPKGTVWECGECGRTWISNGESGLVTFRKESRWAKRRRIKRENR